MPPADDRLPLAHGARSRPRSSRRADCHHPANGIRRRPHPRVRHRRSDRGILRAQLGAFVGCRAQFRGRGGARLLLVRPLDREKARQQGHDLRLPPRRDSRGSRQRRVPRRYRTADLLRSDRANPPAAARSRLVDDHRRRRCDRCEPRHRPVAARRREARHQRALRLPAHDGRCDLRAGRRRCRHRRCPHRSATSCSKARPSAWT